jgi:hypothetical protein
MIHHARWQEETTSPSDVIACAVVKGALPEVFVVTNESITLKLLWHSPIDVSAVVIAFDARDVDAPPVETTPVVLGEVVLVDAHHRNK